MNETNLGKVHLFPSKESYVSNIENIGNNDLALVPLTDLPIGTVLPFSGYVIPIGYLPCNGSAVSRTTYADLFAVIGTTYGAGDGGTTFNLPNLNNNSFLEGSDTAGTVKSAGLPNLYGEVDTTIGWENLTGVFAKGNYNYSLQAIQSSTEPCAHMLYFNASRYNAIYSEDVKTVQPKSVTVMYIIKY